MPLDEYTLLVAIVEAGTSHEAREMKKQMQKLKAKSPKQRRR